MSKFTADEVQTVYGYWGAEVSDRYAADVARDADELAAKRGRTEAERCLSLWARQVAHSDRCDGFAARAESAA